MYNPTQNFYVLAKENFAFNINQGFEKYPESDLNFEGGDLADGIRYLKNFHPTEEAFKARMDEIARLSIELDETEPREMWEGVGYIWPEVHQVLSVFLDLYSKVEPYTLEEAKEIENDNFRNQVLQVLGEQN